jgi:small GTP-binding protein
MALEAAPNQASLKVILVGDLAVGKTSLLQRFQRNSFDFTHQPTIGHSGSRHTLPVNGEDVTLNIWDTAGSEEYASLVPIYARDARVAIIVASAVDRRSIESIARWRDFVRDGSRSASFVVAINKHDLLADPGELEELAATARELHEAYGHVMVVSAKTGLLVDDLFQDAAVLAAQGGHVQQVPHPVAAEPRGSNCC